MKQYDYLIVGAGLYGAVFAREALDAGKTCLVVERRAHTGGNVYCTDVNGVHVHCYGAHIFHTRQKSIWDYVCRYADFHTYVHAPLANYKGEIYNLPFNMNTFRQMWGVSAPEEARAIIAAQQKAVQGKPRNLEEQAISLVGTDIYEKLVKGYTEKQWGRDCASLPAFIIKRLPVRFTYDNNYFSDPWQGIPDGGYNPLVERLLSGAEVLLNTDYFSDRAYFDSLAEKTVYTGTLDSFYDYRFGALEYRSLRFETRALPETDNYQGAAVMNYTDRETPYTRVIEHKHFMRRSVAGTVITEEYPEAWAPGREPYYPVNDEKNQLLYLQYAQLAVREPRTIFGGRLAEYCYYDMDKVVESALLRARSEFASQIPMVKY